jgi:hypothetical protein
MLSRCSKAWSPHLGHSENCILSSSSEGFAVVTFVSVLTTINCKKVCDSCQHQRSSRRDSGNLFYVLFFVRIKSRYFSRKLKEKFVCIEFRSRTEVIVQNGENSRKLKSAETWERKLTWSGTLRDIDQIEVKNRSLYAYFR